MSKVSSNAAVKFSYGAGAGGSYGIGPVGFSGSSTVRHNVVKLDGILSRSQTHNDLIQILAAASLTAARKFCGSLS